MISFNLICDKGHEFEAWFKDSATFEKQKEQNLLTCSICNSTNISKGLSAPNISTGRSKEKSKQEVAQNFFAQARKELVKARKEIESNYENVGEKFATEARKMHYGETEKRNIYGNASENDVKELSEEGVEIAAIPWVDDNLN